MKYDVFDVWPVLSPVILNSTIFIQWRQPREAITAEHEQYPKGITPDLIIVFQTSPGSVKISECPQMNSSSRE